MSVNKINKKENLFEVNIVTQIRYQIIEALNKIAHDKIVPKVNFEQLKFSIERSKDLKFGDFCTNVAMVFGVKNNSAIFLAKEISKSLSKSILFKHIEVVKPGFINLFLNDDCYNSVLLGILANGNACGEFSKKDKYVNIEFVSANPTGLLHVGHARNAAYGDTLARIWQAYGYKVDREYYVNDAGEQIQKLGLSVLIRYLQAHEKKVALPKDCYQSNEIELVAQALQKKYGDEFLSVEFDHNKIKDLKAAEKICDFAKNYLLDIIKLDLRRFGVEMDIWFPESSIYKLDLIYPTLNKLGNKVYKADGALWLKTSEFGDDKDRVLVKKDQTFTYFMPDIAYHNIKLSRGYDVCYDVWGADHKGYVKRMKIAVDLLGYKSRQLDILLMQMVRLLKNGAEFKMSKRTGDYLSLNDLVEEIGVDAARWFLVSQSLSTHLEIDVSKATKRSNDNPIYYVQYAHARINQLLSKANFNKVKNFDLLLTKYERELLNLLATYRHLIITIANNYEVHRLTTYLVSLAKAYHAFYASCKVIDETNIELSTQRYWLSKAVMHVLASGLKMLNIKALDKM